MPLEIVAKMSDKYLARGEDWEVIMWHNSKLFTAGYASGKVKVWSADLSLLTEFDAHEYPIYDLAPGEGTTFYTSSSDCTIRHWDDKDGEFLLLETLEGHEEPPRKLRFHGEQKRLYSGDELGKVRIWEDGKLLSTLETMEEIWDMIIVNDQLITSRLVDVIISIISQREERFRISVKNTFPGKGPLLIVGEKICFGDRNNNNILVKEAFQTGNPNLGTLTGHHALVKSIKSNGNTLYSGGGDKKVIAWDLETMKSIGEVTLDGYVNDIAIDKSTGTVYAAGENQFIVAISMFS